ncbi:hypothetical protein ONS95_009431 [Cadophora gregata]|uniref:uncharacterized protein n=1 Tax=Cadophora gregata TaxID=51156 RepID=UPI0026DB9988|nr:uncharacterized protein ONS95_009431 [Cadophora gregata]KAK0124479.1 hypothetical protein ONS95_009431 [Cadophora gregata]KAK0129667.1 hypothetical protein ONS96_000230 [Cadophora gregata f. sp. sojae]
MLVFQFLLALGLVMLAHARMSTDFVTHAVGVFEIKDFLVFNVVSTELRDPSTRATNRTISFTFTDPNANTTIQCGEAWINNNTPFNYVYCGNGPNANGFSSFRFKTYTHAGKFDLQLTHSFSDPTHYPPPYSFVQYFAPASFELQCNKLRNNARCIQGGPVRGVINQISN